MKAFEIRTKHEIYGKHSYLIFAVSETQARILFNIWMKVNEQTEILEVLEARCDCVYGIR